MLPAGLSFDQAPPIAVPFRFFLTAPLFLLAAAILLVAYGPEMMLSRHMPATLAATHLLTLGFTSMVMCGAMMQMLPVVAGAPVPLPRLLAWLVHLPLALGAAAVAASFLGGVPGLMYAGAGLAALGFAAFLGGAAWSLAHVSSRSPSVPAMGYAAAALLITASLGVGLGIARYGGLDIPYVQLSLLHPLWGLYGWTALLVMGVAYQVVPMFQLTPNYPKAITTWLVGGLFLLLLLRSAAEFAPLPPTVPGVALAVGAGVFAIATLRLQGRRKRKISDATLLFWRIGMGLLLTACLLWPASTLLPAEAAERARLLLGIVVLPGFILAVINGMLYKIVPFLVWFHLQSRYVGKTAIPNMKQLQPDRPARGQMALYLAALALLAGAVFWPPLARISGLLWLASALWLEGNLLRALILYRRTAALATAKKSD
ncbi:MAG: hypothetical protein AB7U30_03795 [Sulfuricellaceae bacterium]|jgi:hypothetical protein